MGDRHLVTVPQGVVGDRLPWGGERQGGGRVVYGYVTTQFDPNFQNHVYLQSIPSKSSPGRNRNIVAYTVASLAPWLDQGHFRGIWVSSRSNPMLSANLGSSFSCAFLEADFTEINSWLNRKHFAWARRHRGGTNAEAVVESRSFSRLYWSFFPADSRPNVASAWYGDGDVDGGLCHQHYHLMFLLHEAILPGTCHQPPRCP